MAIALLPGCKSDVTYNRAIYYAKKGEHQKAIDLFDKLINTDKTNFKFFHNRAILKQRIGDNRGAIFDYSEAIGLQPEHVESFINRGVAKMRLKLYDDAILDYRKAIELDATAGLAYKNLGNVLILKNNVNEACHNWKIAQSYGEDAVEYINQNCLTTN